MNLFLVYIVQLSLKPGMFALLRYEPFLSPHCLALSQTMYACSAEIGTTSKCLLLSLPQTMYTALLRQDPFLRPHCLALSQTMCVCSAEI